MLPLCTTLELRADRHHLAAPKDQVSRAARMLAEEFVHSDNDPPYYSLLTILGNRVQHQVPGQPTVGPVSHHIHSTAAQALQQSTSQWSCRLLR